VVKNFASLLLLGIRYEKGHVMKLEFGLREEAEKNQIYRKRSRVLKEKK
jgi:hypothetical protein